MARCKHTNCRIDEIIAARHSRWIDNYGKLIFNNEYDNQISRVIVCLDCGYSYAFNWKRNVPKWVERERIKLDY